MVSKKKKTFLSELRSFSEEHYEKDWKNMTSIEKTNSMTVFFMQCYIDLEGINTSNTGENLKSELFEKITDASNDLKIDMVFSDFEGDIPKHYLIQTKFYGKPTTAEDYGEVELFMRSPSKLHPKLGEKYKKNYLLEEAIADIDWKNDYFEFIFISLKNTSDNIKNLEEEGIGNFDHPELSDLSERCYFRFYSSTNLNEFIREYYSSQSKEKNKLKIILKKNSNGSDYITYDTGEKKAYIGLIQAKQLADLVDRSKYRNILSMNIRHHLPTTAINKEIVKTSIEEPENFFFYNNGISAMADEIKVDEDNPNVLHCTNFSIINGGQTYKSIADSYKKNRNKLEVDMDALEVMIRITENKEKYKSSNFTDNITRFNNTQNPIKLSDFRSNDPVQTDLKRRFENTRNRVMGKEIRYLNKRERKSTRYFNITLEEFCKYVFSFLQGPIDNFGGTSHVFDTDAEKGGYYKIFEKSENNNYAESLSTEQFNQYASIIFISEFFRKELDSFKKKENWDKHFQVDDVGNNRKPNIHQIIYLSRVILGLLFKTEDTKEILENLVEKKLNNGKWIDKSNSDYKVLHNLFETVFTLACTTYRNVYTEAEKREGFLHRNYLRGNEIMKNLENETNKTFSNPLWKKQVDEYRSNWYSI